MPSILKITQSQPATMSQMPKATTSSSMTFSQTFTLASKVRSKLTRESSSRKPSMRKLVLQANMLDNIMDYISDETSKRVTLKAARVATKAANTQVHFAEPIVQNVSSTLVTEYEVDSESDDDSDYSDEDDYYYSDDDEPDMDDELIVNLSTKQIPVLNLSVIEEEDEVEDDVIEYTPSSYNQDIVMSEETGASHDMPELCRTTTLSDDEEELADKSNYSLERVHSNLPETRSTHNILYPNKSESSNMNTTSLFTINNDNKLDHHRQNAIYSMEDMF